MRPTRAGLKIAELITGSEYIGGAQTHLRELICGLRAHGHDCTVLVGPPDGLFCQQLRQCAIPVRVLKSLRKPVHAIRDSLALAEIVRELVRLEPDLVAVHTAKASFLGRLAAAALRIPCVFTPHGCSVIDRKSGRTNPLFVTLERLAGRLCNATIAVSHYERRLAVHSGIVDARNLTVVHNGVPDSTMIAKPGETPVAITMVARFDPPKDHATLLRAVSGLTDYPWILRLAGAGGLLAATEELAVGLGIQGRVEFVGEYADIPGLLAKSHIFVLASNLEAFPISILEAMRAGLPVIASNVGGVSEAVVDGETGFLVGSGDRHALINRLRVLLQRPDLRIELGRNARARYLDHFTADEMVRKTLAVYTGAVAARNLTAKVAMKTSQ